MHTHIILYGIITMISYEIVAVYISGRVTVQPWQGPSLCVYSKELCVSDYPRRFFYFPKQKTKRRNKNVESYGCRYIITYDIIRLGDYVFC